MFDVVKHHIIPAALSLLPAKMDSPAARAMLLAIGLQESRFEHRRQIRGPARGFWQFERIGLAGVLMAPASTRHADAVCAALLYSRDDPDALHWALEHNDVLACAIARLLLYTLPAPLPTTAEEGWTQYLAAWRPGKPHPTTWAAHYRRAWS